jgi:hypothetical protein
VNGPLGADEKPRSSPDKDQKALDKKVFGTLRTVINTGADLYNRDRDYTGCYRLYQGSLLTLRPLLDTHPDLQKEIDTGLSTAEGQASIAARAFTLRSVLGKMRESLKPTTTGTPAPPPPAPVKKPGK